MQQFYTCYPQITSLLDGGGGSWNLQFLFSLPYRWYIPNLVKIGPIVVEKKILMDDERHSIAIGHLSDTGDLKKLRWIIDIITLLVSSPFPCPVLEKKRLRPEERDHVLKPPPIGWTERKRRGIFTKGLYRVYYYSPSGSGIVKQFVDVTVNISR